MPVVYSLCEIKHAWDGRFHQTRVQSHFVVFPLLCCVVWCVAISVSINIVALLVLAFRVAGLSLLLT